MKKLMSVLIAMLVILSASGATAFAEPTNSMQLMYAKLQLEMAQIAREQAMANMEEIQLVQNEQKKTSSFLNEARRLRNQADSEGIETEMPSDMAEYMEDNGLSYDRTGADLLMTGDEWDTAVESLENYLEQLGMETQRKMIYVQDLMGQYNSYIGGANTQVSDANQLLSSLARGQSMYGDSEAGLAIAALVVGLVLGCVLTLGAQKIRGKQGKA